MLITTEELLDFMNDPNVDRHDQTIAKLIKRATKFVERRLGRHLNGKDATVVRRFSLDSPEVSLILPDVITAPAPKLVGDPLFETRLSVTDAFTALDSVEDLEFVDVDDERGIYTYAIRKDRSFWPCGDDLVQATYKTGYDHANVPEDITEAILGVTAVWWRDRARVTESASEQLSKKRAKGRRLAGGAEIPQHVETILELWERVENPTSNTMALGG